MRVLKVEVESCPPNGVIVRWYADLQHEEPGRWEALAYAMFAVVGVEHVQLLRYSAALTVAPHIIGNARAAIPALLDVLRNELADLPGYTDLLLTEL